MRTTSLVGIFALLVLLSCNSQDSTIPSQTLEGTWDIVGCSDHGVSGVTTGSATFRQDGTFTVLGTVTYPGEPVDSLDVSGTYKVYVGVVTLTTPDGTANWLLEFSGDRVVLTLAGSDPPTSITLKRSATSSLLPSVALPRG
jgi:hypothetical protein